MVQHRRFALAAVLVLVAGGAAADDGQIRASKPDLDKIPFLNNFIAAVDKDPSLLVEAMYISEAYKRNPGLEWGAVGSTRTDARNALAEARDVGQRDFDILEKIATVLGDGSRVGKVALPIWEQIADAKRDAMNRDTAVIDAQQRFAVWETIKPDVVAKLANDIWQQGMNNHFFRLAFDTEFAPDLNIRIGEGFRDYLNRTKDPNYSLLSAVPSDDAWEGLVSDLMAQHQGSYETLMTVLSDQRAYLADLYRRQTDSDASINGLVDWMKSEKQRREQEDIAAAKRRYQEKIDAARAHLTTITALIALKDPKLANDIRRSGTAAIVLANGLKRFMDAANAIDTASSLSTVVGSGNLAMIAVSVTMQIMSIINESGPSPEQLILQELLALRQQIEELRQEMHSRFDRVDAALNLIFETIDRRFDDVDWQLGRLNQRLEDVQVELFNLHGNLNRLTRDMYHLLEAGFRRPFLEGINKNLGYARTYGIELPYHPQYIEAENLFQSWATIHASDELQAGPFSRLFTGRAVHDELARFPLATNINYLSQFPVTLGLPPLSAKRLANPLDLATAAHAWVQLAAENPSSAARVAPSRLAEIKGSATAVRDALRRIPDPNLFGRLRASHEATVANVADLIDRAEADYKTSRHVDQSVDLWAGNAQVTGFVPPGLGESSDIVAFGSNRFYCFDEPSRELCTPKVPAYLLAALPMPLRLAEAMGMGTVTVGYELEAFDWRSYRFPNGHNSAKLRVHIVARWQNAEVVRWTATLRFSTSYPNVGAPDGELFFDFEDHLWRQAWRWWTTGRIEWYWKHAFIDVTPLRNNFLSIASVQVNTTALENVRAAIARALVEHQDRVYSQVLSDLGGATSLQAIALALSGTREVLSGFVELGLPRSLESNDALRMLLLGSERILDDEVIRDVYAGALQRLRFGSPGPRVDIRSINKRRSDALFDSVLGPLLKRVIDGAAVETPSVLEATLRKIDVFSATTAPTKVMLLSGDLRFGRVHIGRARTAKLTITNSGNAAMTVSSITLPGGFVADWTSGVIAGGASKSITVTFTAAAPGMYSGEVIVDADRTAGVNRCAVVGIGSLGDGVRNDFDADGRTDLAVWRPSTGFWYEIKSSDGSAVTEQWGAGFAPYLDVPVPGDYDGDGKTDVAVWRSSTGTWFIIRSSDGGVTTRQWGAGFAPYLDVPVPGDYDGDGKTDMAVWRSSTGTWFIIRSSDGGVTTRQWGAGFAPYLDVAVPGDYDGDGKTDMAVWRSSTGTWFIIRSSDGGVTTRQWGAGFAPYLDVPVPGDYDGDGKTDMAVWRSSMGTWFIIRSSDGSVTTRQWGAGFAPYLDVAVPGDYDGDGKTDMAVWRASTGVWFIIRSSDGSVTTRQWGASTDIPIPRAPIQ